MIQAANIKVAVRIRPLLDDEVRQGHTDSKLEVDQQNTSINVLHDRTNVYKNSQFDFVIDQDSSQRKVFDKVGCADMIKQVVDGYHATIFAYGQTGSGKTFTMEGYKYKQNDKGIPQPIIEYGENEGLVPRSINLLFEQIKQQTNLQKKKFTVYCSYLQIYKEKIYDLLNKAQLKRLVNDGPGLKLKWNKQDHFTVENLYTFECRSPDDVLALYHFGIRNKVVASHNMNNSSSRSHTLLSLTIEQIDIKNPENVILSKLQLVDLAGSERQAFTGNVANKESIDINKSLFTLRQVITALTDKKNQNVNNNNYIPYRESKLTSLLRQSLGGNSYCLMIACLNPCDQYVEENISTLQYAGKASFISNKPIRNDDPKMRLIEDLKKQNKLLNEELSKANDTIQFLSQITGQNPQTIKQNLQNVQMPTHLQNRFTPDQSVLSSSSQDPVRQGSASSAVTEKRGGDQSTDRRTIITERIIKDKDNIEKFFKDKSETLQNIANMNRPMSNLPSAANESKDAITERIIHTVNMMKEVLQSNLNLRETIQKQSEMIDNLNADIFSLQNENEDLRDRIQILEDYTGKDSYSDVTKLVKEKKVLENRVKHLEQTSMNWAQFQATRSNFHQAKETNNKSQVGLVPKATLNNEFNDDYEPVRCAINPNDQSLQQQDGQAYSYAAPTVNKKKKKLEQINYQKQFNRGKGNIIGMQSQMSSEQSAIMSSSDRHQEYKIRTVKSLANAYQQQQQISQQYFRSRANQAQTTKNNPQNTSASKFVQQYQGMNMTSYDKQRHSIGPSNLTTNTFNGHSTQDMSQDDPKTKSPVINKNGKFLNHKQMSMPPQRAHHNNQQDTVVDRYSQHSNAMHDQYTNDFFPSDLQQRSLATNQHQQLRMKQQLETATSFNKPPKSPDKYSASSNKKQRRNQINNVGAGTNGNTNASNSHRDRMNQSADYINNNIAALQRNLDNINPSSNHNSNQRNMTSDPYDDEDAENSSYYRNNTNYDQDDQYYDEEDDNESQMYSNNHNLIHFIYFIVAADQQLIENDAYEALKLQKIKNLQQKNGQSSNNYIGNGSNQNALRNGMDSGLGQLDVSLPMIKQ